MSRFIFLIALLITFSTQVKAEEDSKQSFLGGLFSKEVDMPEAPKPPVIEGVPSIKGLQVPDAPTLYPPTPIFHDEESVVKHFWIFPLFTFFTIGGLYFWILLAAASIYLLYLIDCEYYLKGSGVVTAVLLVLFLFGDFNCFVWAWEHWYYLLLYPIFGGLYALLRWTFFSHWKKLEYLEKRRAFVNEKGITDNVIPDDLLDAWYSTLLASFQELSNWNELRKRIDAEKWVAFCSEYGTVMHSQKELDALKSKYFAGWTNLGPVKIKPFYQDYKDAIITWIEFWPLSFLWWLTEGFLKNFATWAYYKISNSLQRITDYIWSDIPEFKKK